MSREVVGVPEFGQSGLAEELFDGSGLPGAELNQRPSARRQQPGQIGGEGAVGRQPVWTTVQSWPRIEQSHVPLKPGDIAAGYVGRVADDQIEPAGQRRAPVRDGEHGARSKPA